MPLAAAIVVDHVAGRLVPIVATGGRVFTSRAWPISEAELPAWRVLAESESVEEVSLDGIERHSLQISCEAYASASANLDDTLHNLAAAGLTLIHAPPITYTIKTAGIERRFSSQGEAEIGSISITLDAIFFTNKTAPETII